MGTGPEGQLDTAVERLSGEAELPIPTDGEAGKFVTVNAAEDGYALVADRLGVAAAANTLGTVVKKLEVFSAAGVSLGFLPVYDAITTTP